MSRGGRDGLIRVRYLIRMEEGSVSQAADLDDATSPPYLAFDTPPSFLESPSLIC